MFRYFKTLPVNDMNKVNQTKLNYNRSDHELVQTPFQILALRNFKACFPSSVNETT